MIDNKNRKIGIISIIIIIFLLFLGITFAIEDLNLFNSSSKLVVGDIYMYYNSSNTNIMLDSLLPSDSYDPSKYFEFTISGKNTYRKKDIYYDIVLDHGAKSSDSNRTIRIKDNLLKFRLVEVDDEGVENEIFTDKSYEYLKNQRIHVDIISKNTNSLFNKKYRLYTWISSDIKICGGTLNPICDYYTDGNNSLLEWTKVYASINVSVTGDFSEKEIILQENPSYLSNAIKKEIISRVDENNNLLVATEEDDIIYISGKQDDYDETTTDDIDFNYVWYSGKLWRITQINPDGTMKMITDDLMTSINWGATATYSTSWIREWVNQEFLPTLYNYENIIVTDAGWYSVTDSDTEIVKPTGEYTLTDPIALLNNYEYHKSYEKLGDYTNGYLNVGYNWHLITTYDSSSVFGVVSDGSFEINSSTFSRGVRPVIILKPTIELNGGSGTKSDPYIIKGDKEKAIENKTFISSRNSGEYVKLEGDATEKLFRIVGTEFVENKLTTKLVLNDYVKVSGSIPSKQFSSSTTLWTGVSASSTTYLRGYLNTTWLSELNTNMLEKGVYYLGYSDSNYKTTVCATASSEESIKDCIENDNVVSNISNSDYVGLLRVGEIFATQTHDYTSETASSMWLITPKDTSYINNIDNNGNLYAYTSTTNTNGVRPTINLISSVVIRTGSGTEEDPYIVGISNVTEYEYVSSIGYYAYTASETGTYKIELWGARGGTSTLGGKGGYTSGEIELIQGEKIYIYIGGTTSQTTGGANGGGNGSIANGKTGYGGGGATDVRYFGSTIPSTDELLWNSTLGLNSRIMVAAGGGGGAQMNSYLGGYGGGLIGGSAQKFSDGSAVTGGTQVSGGAFGIGTNANTPSYESNGAEGRGGGGGGYYGGNARTRSGNFTNAAGAGGSSFISGHTGSVAITSNTDRTPRTGTDGASCTTGTTDNLCSVHYSGKIFTNTTMIAGNASMPTITLGFETGHASSGYARITYLEE